MKDNQPWIKKYLPNNLKEFHGQTKAVDQLQQFIINFKQQPKKAMLLYGPYGSGKTCSVHALANEIGYEVLEVNASDVRNKASIEEVVGGAISQQPLFNKGKIILLDDIDGLSGTGDRGGATTLAKLISKTGFPMVLTAHEPWDKKLAPIKKKAVLVEFEVLNSDEVLKILQKICKKEKVSYEDQALKTLARYAGGDLRAAINDLQMLSSSGKLSRKDLRSLDQREKTSSMQEALTKIFKTTDPKIAISAFDNVDENVDKWFLWIDENLAKEYTKPADLSRAYDSVSKADRFFRRIRRWQHWRFLVYINALLTSGVAVAKDEKYKEMIKYGPTTRILRIWRANMKYHKRKAIAAKIAEHTHSSTKTALTQTLPYLQIIFKKNKRVAASITEDLELDKDEVDWLRK